MGASVDDDPPLKRTACDFAQAVRRLWSQFARRERGAARIWRSVWGEWGSNGAHDCTGPAQASLKSKLWSSWTAENGSAADHARGTAGRTWLRARFRWRQAKNLAGTMTLRSLVARGSSADTILIRTSSAPPAHFPRDGAAWSVDGKHCNDTICILEPSIAASRQVRCAPHSLNELKLQATVSADDYIAASSSPFKFS